MKYDDFPILNNNEYELLNEHFLSCDSFSRKEFLYKIHYLIECCISLCSGINSQFNFSISKSLSETKDTLKKISTNLQAIHNIETNTHCVEKFNMFLFLKKLVNIIELISTWSQKEEKEFYKTFAQKTNTELINCIKKILNSLEVSNLHFFKHM